MLLLVVSQVTEPLPALIVGAGLGLTSGTTTVICHGLIQQRSPRHLLGRVTAVLSLLTLGISPLLYAGTGAVASAVGIEPFFYAAAAIVLLAAAVLTSARSPHDRAPTTEVNHRT